ncbi:MAG: HAD-IC family P-type ATPase [Actinomycetota bacterium]|nr:HAD-IC family P-type ATPase [Actinomycetota bacterium]
MDEEGASRGLGPGKPAAAGLDPDEVEARRAAGLVNVAPPAPGRTVVDILRANVLTRFNAILGALAVVVFVVGPVQDALFVVVLVANTGIGILQEARSKRALDRLAVLTAARARVVRSGAVAEVALEDVVLDDVVDLRPGDQVPVDATVVASDGLEVDESLLSGESEPVGRGPGDPVLSGSFVVAGSGRARATGVGPAAYAARLQAEARRFSLVRSELQQGTNTILRAVTWVMVPAGIALVVTQVVRSHQALADALRGSVAGVGAMVPEGLVLLTSVAFAAGAVRLARRRVLIQELAAIEGLARVDVLCIDKTGTLTEPGMHVDALEPFGRFGASEVTAVLAALAAADPVPNATLRALAGAHAPDEPWEVVGRVPFSSARRWSATAFAGHGVWVLGGPDVLGAEAGGLLDTAADRHRAEGQRVLLLAQAAALPDERRVPDDLEPAALVVLAERVRPDALATIRYLLDQGVAVIVLSGDAPETVAAVAQRVGLGATGPPCDASGLGERDGSLAAALATVNVLGRVRPHQKLEAVEALQAAGHVVAMVGDGVNDVPALKQADLGIAMGSGSEASRSVARIVLLDSSFAAVPHVLHEGRRVIANIERVANLFVTKTVYAAVLAVTVAVAGIPYPFFPRHLTIVSTLTIGVPGLALALAAGAPRATPGFVAKVVAFTLPSGVVAAVATFTAYALARADDQTAPTVARTSAMLVLFAVGLWVLVMAARPLNVGRVVLVAAMATGLVPLFAIPTARRVLDLAVPPVPVLVEGAVVVGFALVVLTLVRRRERLRLFQSSPPHR